MTRGAGEDRIVNNDAMDRIVDVRSQDGFFDVFFCNLAEIEFETTIERQLASIFRKTSFLIEVMV